MIISISIFLYIYLTALLIYLIFCGFNIYHVFKFGLNRYIALMGTFIYIGGIIIILSVSFFFIFSVDWATEVTLLDLNPRTNYFQPKSL